MADLNDLDDLDLDLPNDFDDLDLEIPNDLDDLDLDNNIPDSADDLDDLDDIDEFDELLNEEMPEKKTKGDGKSQALDKSDSNKDGPWGNNTKKEKSNNITKISIIGISSMLLIGGGWFGYKHFTPAGLDKLLVTAGLIQEEVSESTDIKKISSVKVEKAIVTASVVKETPKAVIQKPVLKIAKEKTAVKIVKKKESNSQLADIVKLIKRNNKELDERISISSEKNDMEISKVTRDISEIKKDISGNNTALSKSLENTDFELAKMQNKVIELSSSINDGDGGDSLNELKNSISHNRDKVSKIIKDIEIINQNNIKAVFEALNSKISILEIDYASLHETISSKDKEISILKNDIKLLNKDIAEITKIKAQSIDNFQSFEIVGFDGTNKSVWLRDSNNNVLKVEKGTFIPEYGTAISILEDGNIVTRLGLVKITLED
jgi:hypothetical protein